MHYIVIQALEAFLTFVFFTIGINFVIDRQSTVKGRRICLGIAIAFFILSILTAIYFIYDIFFLNIVENGEHWLKLILFIIAIVIYAVCICISFSENFQIIGIVTNISLAILITIGAFFVGDFEAIDIKRNEQRIYSQKIVVQEPKVSIEKYELLSLADNTNIEGNFSGSINGNSRGFFFVMRGTLQGTQNGEIKNVDVYKFYYVADSKTRKILPKTLYAEQTPIYPIEEGETPYLAKITTTPYSLDYNVEPAKVCGVGESTVTYELHIPETAILNQFILDSE